MESKISLLFAPNAKRFFATDVCWTYFFWTIFLSKGLDIRKPLVLRVAGGRRLDVHGVDIEFMRDQLG